MKRIILLILTLIILSGCSNVYNLNNFILPDDIEFIACVEQLGTPRKIADYMKENFAHKRNAKYTPDPYTLWLEREGDCNDLATFGMFVANYHGYTTFRVDIWYTDNTGHSIAIYEEEKLSYTCNSDYEYGFVTIQEIIEKYYMGRLYVEYKIYDYENNLVEGSDK